MFILNLTGYVLSKEQMEFAEKVKIGERRHGVSSYPQGGLIFFAVNGGRRMKHSEGHAVVVAFESDKRNHPICGGYADNGWNHPEMEGAPGQQFGIRFADGRVHRRPQNGCHARKIEFGNVCENWVWDE